MEQAKGLCMKEIHVSKESYNEFGNSYYNSLRSGEMVRAEYRLKRRDGSVFWANLSGKAIDPNIPPDLSKGVVWMFDDITEKKENEEKLRELAVKDPLTGIFNRRYFMEQGKVEFERHRRYGQGLSMIMKDIDRFKSVNDRYGHDTGDRVLVRFTELGSAIVRESDIFARVGGEEFAVLLPATALADASAIAERLRTAQEKEKIVIDSDGLVVTLSCGVLECGKEVKSFEDMVKKCDIALYRAKAEGRNRVVCPDVNNQEAVTGSGQKKDDESKMLS
jgi:diguanylate cyclase (GGDEF)-like protein